MDLEKLLTDLASADPAVRDDHACRQLVERVRRGEWDDRLVSIGDVLVHRFTHPEVQARTFAPLVLAAVVERGRTEADVLRGWRDEFATWWLSETDLRGWDSALGWLHAVAHGADLAGAFGTSILPPGDLLMLIGERVTAETDYRYAQMEEDRIARAVGRILTRADLTEAAATGWLAAVDRLFADGGPGPLPIPVANTLAVLKATYVLADRTGTRHGPALTEAIAARLHEAFPAYPALRGE